MCLRFKETKHILENQGINITPERLSKRTLQKQMALLLLPNFCKKCLTGLSRNTHTGQTVKFQNNSKSLLNKTEIINEI